jgi:hypothetical protein
MKNNVINSFLGLESLDNRGFEYVRRWADLTLILPEFVFLKLNTVFDGWEVLYGN